MKFLADENFKFRMSKLLRGNGHDVKLSPKGLDDFKVAALAKEEGRVLLSHDKDFSDTDKFPPSKYSGIVVFKVDPPILPKLSKSLSNLLDKMPSESFSGKLIIVLDEETFWIEE